MLETEHDEYAQSGRGAHGCYYRGIWLIWMLANIVALFVGEYLGETVEALIVQPDSSVTRLLTVEGRVEQAGPAGYIASVAGGAIAGVTYGVAQGLVLLPFLKLRGMLEWMVVTAIGRAARWIAVFVLSQQLIGLVADRHVFGLCLVWLLLSGVGCIAGFALGYPQSVILRRRAYHPSRWLLANLPGPVAASVMTGFGLYIEGENTFRDAASIIVIVITAAITGIVLRDILRHPKPDAEWAVNFEPKLGRGSAQEKVEDTILGSTLYGSTTPETSDSNTTH